MSHRLGRRRAACAAENRDGRRRRVLQRLEKAGSTVRNPSTWVCQAASLHRAYAAAAASAKSPRHHGGPAVVRPRERKRAVRRAGFGPSWIRPRMRATREFGPSDYKSGIRPSRPGQQNPPLLPDDADPRKVYVGNMRKSASESEIKAFFAAAGEVTEVQRPVEADGATKGFCFVTFASPDAVDQGHRHDAIRGISGKENHHSADGPREKAAVQILDRLGLVQSRRPLQLLAQWASGSLRGRGHWPIRGRRRWPSRAAHGTAAACRPPRGFGPTALSEAVRRRLDAPALRALAELETFDADAVVQCLEQAGLTVRNPTAYVIKAVERVRRGGMPGIGIRSRCFNCGEPGHLARDCPSAARGARGAPPDSLASLPPPPSARDNWICGACGGDNRPAP